MRLRLTLLSALEVVAFAGALAYYLTRISAALARAGGNPDSSLAKIAFGVRAIEQQTGSLDRDVRRLNQDLETLASKLRAVDGHLAAVARALATESEGTR